MEGKTGGAGKISGGKLKKGKAKGTPENLIPGTHIFGQWRDGTWRRAIVIERAPATNDPTSKDDWRYYIHYKDFNRRMDEWVQAHRVKWDDDQAEEEPVQPKPSKPADEEDEIAAAGMKRKSEGVLEFIEPDHDEHEGMDEASIREHEEVTKVKNVNFLELGRHRMETWYFSPFPKDFWINGYIETLYVEEFTLRFFRSKAELRRYEAHQPRRYPPGDEIYRHDGLAVFEVDGILQREYCQNLCYLAKLFLDHKTLYYDVDPFFFYVFCEYDEFGYHPFGYYSKEKYSEQGYNLACILTFPPYQRKGYGRFIIQFSYELSKIEQKVGSPEKPLSDLGLLSYRSYWSWILLNILNDKPLHEISIMELSRDTSIKTEDIVSTMQHLGLIKYVNGQFIICATPELIQPKLQRLNAKPGPRVNPNKIRWAPLPVNVKKDKWSLKAKKAIPDD